jgi:hypothetical protein
MAADGGAAAALRVDRLFPLVFAFNYRPSRYLHESWADRIFPPGLFAALAACERAHPRLSAYILEAGGLADRVELDFSSPLRRVALLDGAAIMRAARLLGVAMNWAWMRRVIDRATRAQLAEAIGEPAYRYALERAPFLGLAERHPFAADPTAGDFAGHFDRCGGGVLAAHFANEPAAVVERLRLKLPVDYPLVPDGLAAAGPPEGSGRAIVRVITENEPGWAKLFS